jgi:hypothetical protein
LTQFGVTNVLADPTLELHDGSRTLLASNDNWADTQQAEIQASGYAPPNAKESAIIMVRPSANSTAIVSGKNNTTGNALVEVYVLPPIVWNGPRRRHSTDANSVFWCRASFITP